MNSARVFKGHGFVPNDESVRIPDREINHDVISMMGAQENEEEESPDSILYESDPISVFPTSEAIPDNNPINAPPGVKDVMPNDAEQQPELKKHRKKTDLATNINNDGNVADKERPSLLYKKELESLSKAAAQAAAQSAYFDALNQKKRELKNCISDVQRLLNVLIEEHEEFIEEYTKELKYMAVDIAEKMILEKIPADDGILNRLVLENIKTVKKAEWISVEVSERLVGLVDFVKVELEKPEYKGKTHVVAVSDNDDICRITTNEGTTVSTISVQANNLRKAFSEADMK